ncbi:MAG: sulfite exporter TauE/SafE family protein [Thermodesulfobacteriota bacterium]|nr:sulfite exporter TauE/SafE family protein [Thermodesulfobacteriota bacterium]
MVDLLFNQFVYIDFAGALQVILLGFIGGTLSGFIGSGGAFFMTPGMMNLGVPGVIAVASNITHKFGKAMVGSKKHGEYGNVDKRLSICMVVTAFIGIRLAVWINSGLFKMGGDGHGGGGTAASNLYISMVFILILTFVSISILRDALKPGEGKGPSMKIVELLSKFNLPPYIHFKVADVTVSLWIVSAAGLATGYLAGTIGVGGFIGVPAMIYVFGVPTAVAAGSELYLAMFMGAWGALNYAFQGFVDIRLTMLLYLGSLLGIYIGAYGVKVVNEKLIRIITGLIIILCVFSRAIAVPMYLRQLDLIVFNPEWDKYFNGASKGMLFIAGISGTAVILYHVIKAYRQRRHIQTILTESGYASVSA